MRSYVFLKRFLLFFGFAYLLSVLVIHFYLKKREIFPLFTWSLFSTTPSSQKMDIGLYVTEIDGERIDPSLDFMVSRSRFNYAGDITAYHVIQKLGHAINRKNEEREQSFRGLVEKKYLKSAQSDISYQIVQRTYDPVERWKKGTVMIRILKEFSTSRDPA